MKRITVGVAGHVDHGKTALVQALTSTDTDRLKEEKERGMSIALGFAHLDFPEDEVDLIDVPGHERFLKTMISGATGIEAVVLVVEASELVKPQTIEHLQLTELLGVKKGIVAITKSDLIPPEETDLRALVAEDLCRFLRGTFLEDAPRIFTSARTGEGVEALRNALHSLLRDTEAPSASDPSLIYLPIDRVFSLPGHGTIVTGTLRRGTLNVGQSVEIVGRTGRRHALRAEIRRLQVHNSPLDEVSAGGRVAVNLRGVKTENITHGDAITSPGFLSPARRLDAEMHVSRATAKPVTSGQLARFYFGTTESVARVYPLDRAEILPGDSAPVQLRVRGEAIAAPFRERFVLRTYSSGETIGGGIVADPDAAKHIGGDPAIARRVLTLAYGSVAEMLAAKIEEADWAGCEIEALARMLALSPKRARREASDLPVVVSGGTIVLKALFDAATQEAVGAINRFHAEYPARPGISKEALRALLPAVLTLDVFNHLLETLHKASAIEIEETTIRRKSFAPARTMGPEDIDVARQIAGAFLAGGLTPPAAVDVVGDDSRRSEIYRFLVKSGILIVAEDPKEARAITFHRDAVADAERRLQTHLTEKGITTPEANQILGITRKFGIPLLEHFDGRGITRRIGDRRVAGTALPQPQVV